MLHGKSPIIRRKAKRKVQSCRTVKWPRGFEIVLKFGKCHLSDESILLAYFFCKPIPIWRLKHERMFPHYIDGWVKKHWSRIEGTIS